MRTYLRVRWWCTGSTSIFREDISDEILNHKKWSSSKYLQMFSCIFLPVKMSPSKDVLYTKKIFYNNESVANPILLLGARTTNYRHHQDFLQLSTKFLSLGATLFPRFPSKSRSRSVIWCTTTNYFLHCLLLFLFQAAGWPEASGKKKLFFT